jgi:hypothetical protein
MGNTVVVTRHTALVEYLREIGLLVGDGAHVLSHVSEEEVAGKDVIGVLPFRLAAVANTVTEVPLALTPEDRGQELGLDRIRAIAGVPVTYKVTMVE